MNLDFLEMKMNGRSFQNPGGCIVSVPSFPNYRFQRQTGRKVAHFKNENECLECASDLGN